MVSSKPDYSGRWSSYDRPVVFKIAGSKWAARPKSTPAIFQFAGVCHAPAQGLQIPKVAGNTMEILDIIFR
ncbi:hypothetical protein N7468_001792 [Penicillium chermesinum]|uniref:Uncharacterized protein n=1 Tax=Penicillium chermesinum TaxID=63820 RepID=A0A9W9PHG5_9EURO|nr:uncharacterized protein N7468_001792 [Penicillium chermesinum]KAJ5246809.1 hypothetical protein N7468_001792 [Penicillium chermesinum]